mgnify:FL=1
MRYKMTFLGLGVSNFSVLKNVLQDNPEDFFVSSADLIAPEKRDFLSRHSIAFEEGLHTQRLLDTERLMISPSVNPDHEIYKQAKQKGIDIKTDIELFLETKTPVHYIIAITGTNGKTTTVELIQHLLSLSHEAYAVGNIGYSPFELINKDLSRAVLVFELSSFQIEHLKKTRQFFDLAGITNIAQDHLDWHGGYQAYKQAKLSLLQCSKEAVLPVELNGVKAYQYGISDGLNGSVNEYTKQLIFSLPGRHGFVDLSKITLKGIHNLKNIALAALCCFLFGIDEQQIEKGLNTFVAGEHRLERFLEFNGRTYVNDSKSTNAHSLISAIQSFQEPSKRVRLLAGAKDKGDDYTQLAKVIFNGCKKVYLCGESAQRLYASISDSVEKQLFTNWHEAIQTAIKESKPGEVILFSPGGSSFDLFENYKKRGEFFKEQVQSFVSLL